MRRKWVALAAAVVIGLAAGWYFLSPAWTLSQMASAAKERDAEELAEYVDFPRLRESAKSQVKAHLAAEMMKQEGDGFAALGMAIGMQMVDPMIEAMFTPETMRAALAKEAKSDAASKSAVKAPAGMNLEGKKIVRDGLSRFRVQDEKDPSSGEFVFERRGLGWVLTEFRMPLDKFPAAGR